jgi:hypothetical protein
MLVQQGLHLVAQKNVDHVHPGFHGDVRHGISSVSVVEDGGRDEVEEGVLDDDVEEVAASGLEGIRESYDGEKGRGRRKEWKEKGRVREKKSEDF